MTTARWILVLVVVLLLGGIGGWILAGRGQSQSPPPTPDIDAVITIEKGANGACDVITVTPGVNPPTKRPEEEVIWTTFNACDVQATVTIGNWQPEDPTTKKVVEARPGPHKTSDKPRVWIRKDETGNPVKEGKYGTPCT